MVAVAVLGAVAEISAGTVVVARTFMVVMGADGVLGDSVVFVGVKVGNIVTCDEEIGKIVTAIVMISGDTVVIIGGAFVVVMCVAWLRAGTILVKATVVLDRGAVVIWNAVVVAAVGVFVPGIEVEV